MSIAAAPGRADCLNQTPQAMLGHMRRPATLIALLPIALAGLVACDSEAAGDQPSIAVADIRRIAETAGDSAKTCPLDLNLSEALDGAGAEGEITTTRVDVNHSSTEEPAEDPMAAQLEDGLSPLDAAAGVFIECAFTVGDEDLVVTLIATKAGEQAAFNVMLPGLGRAAELDEEALMDYAESGPSVGEVELAGEDVTVLRMDVTGTGDAALMVAGKAVSGLSDGERRTTTRNLARQVSES